MERGRYWSWVCSLADAGVPSLQENFTIFFLILAEMLGEFANNYLLDNQAESLTHQLMALHVITCWMVDAIGKRNKKGGMPRPW